jgi:hypothetical protein
MKISIKLITFVILVLIALSKILFFPQKYKSLPKLVFLSLTKEQVIRNKKVEEFILFISESRLGFNFGSDFLLLEVRHLLPIRTNTRKSNLKITRDIYLYIIFNYVDLREFLKLYKRFKYYIDMAELSQVNFRNYKKNVFDPAAWSMFNEKVDKNTYLVTTQSQLTNLSSVFKFRNSLIKKIMMWYSTNSIPIYRTQEVHSNFWLPNDAKNYIDEHYVWNADQASSLMKQGALNCKIVGSILFYPRKLALSRMKYVTYFDVTPYSQADTIYNEKSCIEVLLNISSAIQELNEIHHENFTLRVKSKRDYSNKHSIKYIQLIKQLQREEKISIISANENLYKCISESCAILSIPFSSPVEVGAEMNVPGAYYFEGNNEWDLISRGSPYPLLLSKAEVRNWLDNIVYETSYKS